MVRYIITAGQPFHYISSFYPYFNGDFLEFVAQLSRTTLTNLGESYTRAFLMARLFNIAAQFQLYITL